MAEKHCCNASGTACCDMTNAEESTVDHDMCIAIVSEDGTHLVVYDCSGAPRRFHHPGGIPMHKLCFHGHNVEEDDMLTPCLDENGYHGEPEEPCFCGVDTPHIHAHLHEVCQKKTRDCEMEFSFLASQILYPVENTFKDEQLQIAATQGMPDECNAVPKTEVAKHLKRLHRVQHDKHIDYLVYDSAKEKLYLQHEDCLKCDGVDIHGTFDNIGMRKLPTGDLSTLGKLQIHFFKASKKKFNVMDHFSDFFKLHEDPRVQAAAVARGSAGTVRSTIICSEICCPKEISQVRKLLDHLPGVQQVKVIVPLRQVMIEHNPEMQTAKQLVEHLSQLGSSLLRDGAQQLQSLSITSVLSLDSDAGTLPTTEELMTTLQSSVVLESISVQGTDVHITYNPLSTTLQQIIEGLSPLKVSIEKDGESRLLMDGNTQISVASATIGRTWPRPTVVVSGVLWIVSMLSLIGVSL